MANKEILAELIDVKKAAILKVLFHSKEELCLKEIAQKSTVPMSSTFRILKELVGLQVVQRREWKTSKVYSSLDNERVEFLKELFQEEVDGVSEFIESIKDIPGIQSIVLHGVKKKGRANILLIGENIETAKADSICSILKEKGFELTYLTLTKVQYAQMQKMGLYQGEKVVLK